jgi:predicted dehydrogenase
MRILIAGLGAIGQRHARNLRALYGESLELFALRRRRVPYVVTDSLERDRSRCVEAELAMTVFENISDALEAKPDAVFVCTPSSQHLEIAQDAALAGCHLFIEKPLSHSLDGIDRLRETVESKALVVLIGCQWRYHPCVRWLRNLLGTGTLGRLTNAEFDYVEYLPDWHPYEDYRTSYAARAELGGGVVLTQIHDYDLAWSLFGAPSSVSATGGHLSPLEIDVEDTVDAQLDGASVAINVRQTFASRPSRRTIRVEGENGSLTVDLLAARVTLYGHDTSTVEFAGYQRNQMFVDEAKHFLACVSGQEKPAVPLDDGIAVLRVALAVKNSLRSGGAVQIP